MTAPRPFRFSLQTTQAADRAGWVEMARRAEGMGFDLLVTADHLADCLIPLAPLLTVAETTNLRVGTMVLNNDLRHPAMLAREAAAIDLLTDGRLELGIGAGHARPEYEHIGLPFDDAGVRVARLRESVQLLRRLLDGEEVHHDGDHYRLDGERCHPRTVQRPLPILVGGGGRHVLATAARFADAVGFTGLGRTLADGHDHEATGFPPTAVDQQVAWVRSQAGERHDRLELQVLVQDVVITDHPRAAAERVRVELPSLTVDELLETPYLLIGTVPSIMERLQANRERWGFSHLTVRPGVMDAMAPVIEALAGA